MVIGRWGANIDGTGGRANRVVSVVHVPEIRSLVRGGRPPQPACVASWALYLDHGLEAGKGWRAEKVRILGGEEVVTCGMGSMSLDHAGCAHTH